MGKKNVEKRPRFSVVAGESELELGIFLRKIALWAPFCEFVGRTKKDLREKWGKIWSFWRVSAPPAARESMSEERSGVRYDVLGG